MESPNTFYIECKNCKKVLPPLFGTLHTVKDREVSCYCDKPEIGKIKIKTDAEMIIN